MICTPSSLRLSVSGSPRRVKLDISQDLFATPSRTPLPKHLRSQLLSRNSTVQYTYAVKIFLKVFATYFLHAWCLTVNGLLHLMRMSATCSLLSFVTDCVWGCRSVGCREGVCWVWPTAPSALGGVYTPSPYETVCEDRGRDLRWGLLHHQRLRRHCCTQSMCLCIYSIFILCVHYFVC